MVVWQSTSIYKQEESARRGEGNSGRPRMLVKPPAVHCSTRHKKN